MSHARRQHHPNAVTADVEMELLQLKSAQAIVGRT